MWNETMITVRVSPIIGGSMRHTIMRMVRHVVSLTVILGVCILLGAPAPVRAPIFTPPVVVEMVPVAPPPAGRTPAHRRVRPRRPTSAVTCLAQNLYFEARNEPYEALQAVAATVFNRMDTKWYPDSVCAVVYQPFQYSWTLDTTNWKRQPPPVFLRLAQTFLTDRAILTHTYPVTHFHHVNIVPRWAESLTYVETLGSHKFYGL